MLGFLWGEKMPLPMPEELTDPTATNTQMKQRLAQLAANATSKEEFSIGLSNTLRNVDLKSENLFKHWETFGYTNNMPVRRYTAVSTFNNYVAGTYQNSNNEYVQLSVAASGSSSIKHYYDTGIAAQKFEAEFKVTAQNVAGDAIGIGFKNGENYNIVAFSNSGNLSTVSDYTNTLVTSGLGGYVLGDIVKFIYDGTYINVYVNNIFKGKVILAQSGTIAIGQVGFSQYLSIVASKSKDPVRDYVLGELAKIPEPEPDVLPQAKSYTETYVQDQSVNLFKQTASMSYANNMTVTRFTAAATSNTYVSGTYQTTVEGGVQLSVTAAGSNGIKHYFTTSIEPQYFEAEFTVTHQQFGGDAVGVGFKTGDNFEIIAFSNSGVFSRINNFTTTQLQTGLGGYAVNDTVKFIYDGTKIEVFVNNSKIAEALITAGDFITIGQSGFSQYLSSISGQSIDPVRDYVKAEIAEVAKQGLSKSYYSFNVGVAPLLGAFKAYTQVKNDLYVGFDIKHEYDMREEIYQDYWRIFRADFYKLENGVMQPTGKVALGIGESEFVYRTNSDKVDYTGGYHGDELVTDIKFLADGILIPTTANIALTACEQFEYIEKSTMHETANKTTGVVTEHPKIADHVKHTLISNSGYKVRNKCVWNYTGLMSTLYHGISCIHKDVASTVFIDDTYTDQPMTGSTTEYFKAIGARLYKARNEANGLAVEAAAYQVTPSDKDALSEFFVHDRSTDSKYYRKTPAGNVAVGEKHESYFECKFMAVGS